MLWLLRMLCVQNAREADPNAMLRLAKMYLQGQGCQRNIALAQEWVRKAR
jgi:TPR repeat protein